MRSTSLNILQVSKSDISGGAERIAWDLFQQFREKQQGSWMAVSRKISTDADVLQIKSPESLSRWLHFWEGVQHRMIGLSPKMLGMGVWRGSRLVPWLANPMKAWGRYCGIEDFHHPGFGNLLKQLPVKLDIVHCHNLHGGYFDLRLLPSLSRSMPVVLTLHDAWMLSGHCAHSFGCERWKSGCGQCPDLTIYPEIACDATAYNWRRKQKLYQRSKFYIGCPSRWLMGKVEQSMLMSGAVECRVIPNGVDLKIFNSQGRPGARETLGIPAKSRMLLFTANSIRNNPWKDYQMLRAVLEQVRMRLKGVDLLFVALGEDGPSEQFGRAELRFVPYQKDPRLVAHYYQAADVYVHPAKIETFCLSVIEAAACGTPVVATDVGGLSEQIENGKTGYLVPSGDSVMMAERIVEILQNNGLWLSMEVASAERARRMYCMGKHANEYLEWYNEIIEQRSQKRVEA